MSSARNLTMGLLFISCNILAAPAPDENSQLAINKLNTFTLARIQIRDSIPKNITRVYESPDDYIRYMGAVDLGSSGELLALNISSVERENAINGYITTTMLSELHNTEYGWHGKYSYHIVAKDKKTQKETAFFDMQGEIIYRIDPKGRITSSIERADVSIAAKTKQTGIAQSLYIYNESGKVRNVIRLSNLPDDSDYIKINYDDVGRLLNIQAKHTVNNYQYDKQGREFLEHEIQTYFDIKKTSTKCFEWNSDGQCTQSNEQVTRTSKKSKNEHNMTVKTTYTYWGQ